MPSDFRNVRERVMDRFPIMRSSAFERRMLFQRDRHAFEGPVISAFERASIVPSS
jgi:hypothetical protein